MEDIEMIWTDKKRYFGLPISFTKYSLSNERVFVQRGLLKANHEQMMLNSVVDVKCSIAIWQLFFGVGTVTVISNDKSQPEVVLQNIQNPIHVKEVIHHLTETIQRKHRGCIGKIMGEDLDNDDLDTD